ncbi:MAG: hypothetical protein COV48_00080 [Elusimicrobia bacterium CG11_big_fil_rev_8_21_14_0_20_64_6]|nr:MAG: hypothetical protein COV48_00080 [Elusimicrobia bacterium CG11_big_fil_rev_8_21_14_0_20_64_6]
MIKVGCAGYPVGRDRYWRSLAFLEAETGKGLPRLETLAAWRADIPSDGEAALQALRTVTHGPEDRGFPVSGRKLPKKRQSLCGAFRESLEVHEAWMATKAAAAALGSKIVIFETPSSFQPGSDRLRDMYRFFKGASRGKLVFVWHPRGTEWDSLGDKVCAELGLIRAFDPLRQPPPRKGAFLYMRPSVARVGSLSVANMSTIAAAAADVPAYVALSHRSSFRDAERLKAALSSGSAS